MKIREGFVSNSSSSSFIMSLAIVTDKEKFNELYAVNLNTDIWPCGVEVQTLKSIKEQTGWYNEVEFKSSNGCDRIVCEAFDGTPISIDVTGLPDDTIVYYSSNSGDEPSWDEDSGEYDYDDVELDWFTEEAQEAAKFVYLPFMKGEYTYGGGFNG